MAHETNKNNRKRPLEIEDDDETSPKRQRNNDHNHNHNGSAHEHTHYQKFSKMISNITPYDDCYFKHDDADVMIIGSSISNEKNDEIKRLKRDCRELKEKLRILKNIAISQFEPDFHLITIDKNNGTIASKGVASLKNKMMHIFNQNVCNIKINDIQHKKYAKAIKTFLKRNKNTINHTNNAINPDIAYAKERWHKQRNLLKIKDNNTAEDIDAADDVECLMQNTTVISEYDIKKHTVIGEYIGLQVSVNEMEDIYYRSSDRGLANLFAFELVIEGLSDIDDEDEDEDEDKDNDEHHEVQQVIAEMIQSGSKFVIDAIGWERMKKCDHLLMYIQPVNKEDETRNVEYVTATVNGWPRIFVITKRNIEKDETLCGYFGETFKMAEYQRLRDKRNRARIGVYIDNILEMPLFVL